MDTTNTTGGLYAEPYYSPYINADCKLSSELAASYQPASLLSASCQAVNALVEQINEPYTGNNNSARLAWLKRRRTLLTQRAAVIAQALKDLGSTDVVDHTAIDIRSISGLVGTLTAAVPGVGTLIGGAVGLVGTLIGGLIDQTGSNKTKRDEEIALYKADYVGLLDILDKTNKEIDQLNRTNYMIWGVLIVLIVILVVKRRMK